jgi:flavin reductase (DIM6/NTAB) family NADH-FMN oxidoreductase RutF
LSRALKKYTKKSFPVEGVRRFLEPGPIVLVSSALNGEENIMTMGWHSMMGYDMIGCYIWEANYSHNMIKKSKQCCINIPEVHLMEQSIAIGNSTGAEIDKFTAFGLTPVPAKKIEAPLIKECYANLECEVIDSHLVSKYNFFILQVVAAHAATAPKYPKTFHYTGDGVFMLSGSHANRSKLFNPEML